MSISKSALAEALALAEDLLRNIELNELPLANITLKASRLARLLGDFKFHQIFTYEVSGYPGTPDGLPKDVYEFAVFAGREFLQKNLKTNENDKYVYMTSIEELELQTKIAPTALSAAKDPSVSISSANPNQTVWNPQGNQKERQQIISNTALANKRLSNRRTFVHKYVLDKYYELKFSGIADDVFTRIRRRVDGRISDAIPESIKKFSSVYENLQSENTEDWSNAVHSCRRILQDLADSVCPAQDNIVKNVKGKAVTIKLDTDNYINRIIHFIESKADSERFRDIVGSNLHFVGNRLDGVFKAAQKGSHTTIVKKEEADRYVAYTYMLIGDILSLL